MTKTKPTLNGSSELLAKAIRKVFEETQETTVSLMSEIDKDVKDLKGEVSGIKGEMSGVKEQVSGMSKKLDKIQASQ